MLDKSRADWKDFKKTDETVEEELEMHKRSGDQVQEGRWVGGWVVDGEVGWGGGLEVHERSGTRWVWAVSGV